MTTLADPEISRAVGRLEQGQETFLAELTGLEKRTVRLEQRANRIAALAEPVRRDIDSLSTASRAAGVTIADHALRITALELPAEQAKKDSVSRRDRMRTRVKQVGGALGAIFVFVEWVAKPIVGLIAESWWRNLPPPGH